MSTTPVTLSILDREYQVACEPGQEAGLISAAAYLDKKMREIRDRGNVIGIDRIAVMAALNIAYDLLELKPLEEERRSIAAHIASLRDTVSKAVAAQEELLDTA